jgi:hypothetical protein
MVIGLTIVGFGTSAPELVVNLFASFEKTQSWLWGILLELFFLLYFDFKIKKWSQSKSETIFPDLNIRINIEICSISTRIWKIKSWLSFSILRMEVSISQKKRVISGISLMYLKHKTKL